MMFRRSFLTKIGTLPFIPLTPFTSSVLGGSVAEQKQLLRYRFKKGEELRWNVLQTLKRRTSIGGTEEVIETTSRSTKVWTVINLASDGMATFEYKVEYVIMRDVRLDGEGKKETEYNSRKDKEIPGMFINLDGSIGVPLAHISVDVSGKTVKKPLRIYYGNANTENRMVIPLPKEPVVAGESWTEPASFEIQLGNKKINKISARQKFLLENIRSGLAAIKFVTQITTPLLPADEWQILDQSPDKFSVGKMELDLDAGHFIRQEATIDKRVVGFREAGSNIHHLTRLTECCCGLNSCELCSFR
jgi:hypothetical protein